MVFLMRIVACLPLPVVHGLGWALYLVAFHVIRWRVPIARRNIDAAFPEKPPRERARILRECYRNLGMTMLEAVWGYGASAEELTRRVVIENSGMIEQWKKQGRSVILLTGHVCNWEWLLLAAGAQLGVPLDIVYKPLRLAAVDAYVRDARRRFGANPIPHKSFLFEVLRQAGDMRTYGVLADQTPGRNTPKYWTRFLHQDTPFFLGPERIARFLDATVVYVGMTRVARGYYSVHLDVIADPPYGDEAGAEIAEAYARKLEATIVGAPADWLWIHKKWKYPRSADPTESRRPKVRQ